MVKFAIVLLCDEYVDILLGDFKRRKLNTKICNKMVQRLNGDYFSASVFYAKPIDRNPSGA